MTDKKKPDTSDKKEKGTDDPKARSWVEQDPFVAPSTATTSAPKETKKPPAKSSAGSIESPKVEVDLKLGKTPNKPEPRSSIPSYDPGEDTDPGPRRRRFWGLPGWGWLVIIGTGLGVMLLTCDLRNRNRYLMVCSAHKVSLKKGRTLPLPFGEETIGGAEFKPVAISAEADCRTRVYHSQEEAELGFLDFVLDQVRAALDNPGTADLTKARQKVEQALLLTRRHRKRRKETQRMLAELAYREGRSGLARVENELRKALALFQKAQKLDGERWEDLDDWVSHLEDLLRTVSPSPGGTPAPRMTLPSRSSIPRRLHLGPTKRTTPLPPASAPAITPDAGTPQTGGGILM